MLRVRTALLRASHLSSWRCQTNWCRIRQVVGNRGMGANIYGGSHSGGEYLWRQP